MKLSKTFFTVGALGVSVAILQLKKSDELNVKTIPICEIKFSHLINASVYLI